MLLNNITQIAQFLEAKSGYHGTTERSQWGALSSNRLLPFTAYGRDAKAGTPVGYEPPSSWAPALKSGGLGATRQITGSGGVTAGNLAAGLSAQAALTGAGDITDAALGLIVSLVAALTGIGLLTSDLVGKANAAAALAGAGDLSGALDALGHLLAALNGAGTLSATARAEGFMSSDINVTGDLLTTATVGPAVLAAAVEAGLSVQDFLRIILAATALKKSGTAPGAITFRDVADAKDRIVGTVDAVGQRTAVTLDPS